MIEKVGIMFFQNGRLLLKKHKSNLTYQMIGEELETLETPLQAAIRWSHKELGNKAIIDETKFEYAFDFTCKTPDSSIKTHTTIFKYNGILKGQLSLSNEIENFMLFGADSDYNLVSPNLKNKIIPYCIYNGLIKIVDFQQIKNTALTDQEKYIKKITELNVKLKVKKGVYNELL